MPGWCAPSGPPRPAGFGSRAQTSTLPASFPPALAEQAGSVLAAYGADGNHGIEVARFSATPGAPGTVTVTDPIAGWTSLDGVFLMPGAAGGEQLLVSRRAQHCARGPPQRP